MQAYKKRLNTKPKLTDFGFGDETLGDICTLLNVENTEVIHNSLRVLDHKEEDNLYLVHFLEDSENVDHVRGTVIEVIDTPRIICSSFPYTPELEHDSSEINDLIEEDISSCRITYAHEGTLLRMFRGTKTGEWYISTHKKIDARRSRWGGPKFGDLFDEIWGALDINDILYENISYFFLMSHPSNRVICQSIGSFLTCVGANNEDGGWTFSPPLKGMHPKIHPAASVPIDTRDGLIELSSKLDWKYTTGCLVTNVTGPGSFDISCVKIVPPQYTLFRNIRGMNPNIVYRFVELFINQDNIHPESDDIEIMYLMFPEHKELFDETYERLNGLVTNLVQLFITRYASRNSWFELPQEEHICLTRCKNIIGEPRKTTEEAIGGAMIRELYDTPPSKVYRMLKRYTIAVTQEDFEESDGPIVPLETP